jgi:hypothetical protein
MFQALLKKRATNRSYKRTVDDCLTVLFCGFPDSLLPSLRQRVGNSSLVRRGQAEGPMFACAPCKWRSSILGRSSVT